MTPPTNLNLNEQGLSEPLGRVADAAEALQTWASDVASRRAKRPTMNPLEAQLDRDEGERLLALLLAQLSPVLGHLSSVGGGKP